MISRHSCQGCGLETDSSLCCPKCGEFGRQAHFCSQQCFASNWTTHSTIHQILHQNRILAEKEQQKKRSNVAAMAFQSLKSMILTNNNQKTQPTYEETFKKTDIDKRQTGQTGKRWIAVVLVVTILCCFAVQRPTETSNEDLSDLKMDFLAFKESVKLRLDSQEAAIHNLARDLRSGLREVTNANQN